MPLLVKQVETPARSSSNGKASLTTLEQHYENVENRIALPAKEKSKNDDLPPLECVAFIDFFAHLVINFLQKGGSSFY